jgi:hypothetical protein
LTIRFFANTLLAQCDVLAAGIVQAEKARARLLQAVFNGKGKITDNGNGR